MRSADDIVLAQCNS